MTNTNVKMNTIKLVQAAMIIAILILLQVTKLGFIMTPTISITIMHVPVIIGAIMLGPVYGGFFGGAMGLCSMISAVYSSKPGDVLFNPAASGHPLGTIFMTVIVRILIGVVAGLVFKYLEKKGVKPIVNAIITAVLATLTNTVGVISTIWLIFTEYNKTFKYVIETIFAVNFLLEVSAAVIFSIAIAKVLPVIKKKN